MAMGVPVSRATKVKALQRYMVDKCRADDVAAELGISRASIYTWKKDPQLVADAKARGPSVKAGGGDDDPSEDPFAIELPADASDPAVMQAVALLYAAGGMPEDCDDLAGWPRGTVARWIEAIDEGEDVDQAVIERVAQLRQARAKFKGGMLMLAQTGGRGWQGALKALERRYRSEWAEERSEDAADDLDDLDDDELDELLEDLPTGRSGPVVTDQFA